MNLHLRYWLLAMLFAAISTVCLDSQAIAAPEEDAPVILSFSQQDLDGDGSPDLAILETEYAGMHLRVLVFDQGADMQWSEDWRTGTDFANDVWLFQTDDGQTRLAIRFIHDTTGYTAELFDDVNGDLNVSFETRDLTQIDISESPFPTLRVVAQQPWMLHDGNVNRLIHIRAYRPVLGYLASFSVDYLPRDGRLAQELEIADADGDGVADYQLRRDFPDVPSGSSPFRAEIYVNIDKEPQPVYSGYLLWPYLGLADPETQLNRRDPQDLSSAPILMDWQQGRIRGITGFLAGSYAINRWYFLSSVPLVKQQINELDWEQLAYYNFAGSSTPDMILRLIRSGPNMAVRVGQRTLDLQMAAFSWHHTNLGTLKWDYKLELASTHELPSNVVAFKDFKLREVPFEDLLPEFAARHWAYGTFVAAEGNSYDTNEGIREWGTLDGVITNISDKLNGIIPDASLDLIAYLRGRTDTFPAHFYSEIREGFRGEFGELHGPARLYFSPIDRKLHLLKASQGVWNLSPLDKIRYQDLDGDGYLDQWTYQHVVTGTVPLTVTEQLMAARDHLIYSGQDLVALRQTSVTPSLFETTPPRNREEWEVLGQQLDAQKPTFAPHDLLTMMRQFDGPEQSVQGARVTSYRPTSEGGFRFVLELNPGFQIMGADLLGLTGLAPGRYAVENRYGAFYTSEWTPPDLRIHLLPTGLTQGEPAQFQTSGVLFQVTNQGQQDAFTVIVTGEATDENGILTLFGEQEVAVASGTAEKVTFDWAPNSPGPHTIMLRAAVLDTGNQEWLAPAEWTETIWVSNAASTSWHDAASAFGLVPVAPLLVFLGSMLLVLGVFLVYWRHVTQTV